MEQPSGVIVSGGHCRHPCVHDPSRLICHTCDVDTHTHTHTLTHLTNIVDPVQPCSNQGRHFHGKRRWHEEAWRTLLRFRLRLLLRRQTTNQGVDSPCHNQPPNQTTERACCCCGERSKTQNRSRMVSTTTFVYEADGQKFL
jgi:hypothetical protein